MQLISKNEAKERPCRHIQGSSVINHVFVRFILINAIMNFRNKENTML